MTIGAEPGGRQVLDVGAILAAMQDQIDELMAAVEALQGRLDEQGQQPKPS